MLAGVSHYVRKECAGSDEFGLGTQTPSGYCLSGEWPNGTSRRTTAFLGGKLADTPSFSVSFSLSYVFWRRFLYYFKNINIKNINFILSEKGH